MSEDASDAQKATLRQYRQLADYLLQDDSRQLLHITYGHILDIPELKRDILQFLKDNRALYEAETEDLYDRHFAAMYERA